MNYTEQKTIENNTPDAKFNQLTRSSTDTKLKSEYIALYGYSARKNPNVKCFAELPAGEVVLKKYRR